MIILPSLEIVPAKYSGSTLLSQIPIDGTGDFTVSRALNTATRVNSLGNIEVVNADTPRIDYFASGGTVGCPALLVEPSGTNLFLQSAGFEVSGTWSTTNITVTTGSTAAFTAPDNSTNADLITASTSGATGIGQNTTIASGTYTISVFAKAGNYGLFRIGNVSSGERAAWFNLDAGVVTGTVNGGTASMQNYGNGWYRCIYTSSGMVSGSTFFAPSDAPNSTTAVSGSSMYFWGAQLETGSVATSYIPTTTGTVTRNADVISATGAVSGSIGQTEGTLYAEVDYRNTALTNARIPLYIMNAGSPTVNSLRIEISGAGAWFASLRANNTTIWTLSTAASQPAGIYKIAVSYKNTDSVIYINGNQVATSNAAFTFSAALNKVAFEGTAAGNNTFNDRIRAAAIYPNRLTNTQLALLTSPYTSYSSMASALSYTLG